MKTRPGDMILLQRCTKNYDHIMHGSRDIVRDGRTDANDQMEKK